MSDVCGDTAAFCVCDEAADHDGPHECSCGGAWTGNWEDDTWKGVRNPGSNLDFSFDG